MSSNTQKLRILRARTDHDLLVVVSRELDRGLALVNSATTRNSPLFGQAEKALSTATTLLPRICGVSQDERLRIEARATELRSLLALVPAYAAVRPLPASVAS